MLGMPVENQAVARSPQGMAIAVAERPAKSIRRQLCASGTSSITPFRRTRPPRWPIRKDSAIVRAVPGLTCARASNARTRWEHRGEAVGGDDIKPDARADHDSGGLRIRVPALRC